MNKYIFLILILVFFLKTGNVLSSSKIFNVDNIVVRNTTNQEISQVINKAFKEGFKQLIHKILIKSDFEKVSSTKLDDISKLISSYQIIEEEKINKKSTLINLTFSREKINNFFYQKNISYADIIDTDIILLPLLIEDKNIYLYSGNYFYSNWNTEDQEQESNFINYLLPLENLDDLEYLNNNIDNLESINVSKIFSEYETKDYVFLIINNKPNKTDVFIRAYIDRKQTIKNINIKFTNSNKKLIYKKIIKDLKFEIGEIFKSQNLIDLNAPSFLNVKLKINKSEDLMNFQNSLKNIDLIENYYVLELTDKYAKLRVKYLGKINKIKNTFLKKGIKVIIKDNEWNLVLI